MAGKHNLNQSEKTGLNFITLPIEMCYYVARNKLFSPFELYLLLKFHCDGVLKIDRKQLAKKLNKTPRTVSNNLHSLIKLNWIGHNKETDNYFIRGLDKVRKEYGFNKRIGVGFRKKYLHRVKGFVIGAIIGNLNNNARRALRGKDADNKGKAIQSLFPYYPKYMAVGNWALAKVLSVSVSTASNYKTLAINDGFVKRKRHSIIIGKNVDAGLVKKYYPEYRHLINVNNGTVIINRPDQFRCNLGYSRRKKIDTYIKG